MLIFRFIIAWVYMLKKHICFLILSSATRLYPSLLALVSLSPFFLNTQSVLIGQLIHAWVSTANRWPSEAFGDTRTSLGKNLFGVFSCEHTKQMRWLAVGCRSHWILWLVVCKLYDHSDWQCASKSARCVGRAEYCVRFVFLCTLFCHFLFSYFGVLAQD